MHAKNVSADGLRPCCCLQRKHDKVYQWKALRMISRESLPIFARTAFTGDLEEAARGFFPAEVRSFFAPAPVAGSCRSSHLGFGATACIWCRSYVFFWHRFALSDDTAVFWVIKPSSYTMFTHL